MRRRGRWAIVAVLATLFAAGLAVPAHATSCGHVTAADVLGADVVVVGTVVDVEGPFMATYSPHPVRWTIEVDAVLRGEAPRVLLAVAEDMSAIETSRPGVVALHRDGDRLLVGFCGTMGLSQEESDRVVMLAGGGHQPSERTDLPGAVAPDVGLTTTGAVRWVLLLAGLVVAAVVAWDRLRAARRRARAVPAP